MQRLSKERRGSWTSSYDNDEGQDTATEMVTNTRRVAIMAIAP